MSHFGPELSPDDAPALPLWIDGHAFLLMADQFFAVRDASGKAVRRVPLYGDDAVAIAVDSTRRGLTEWRGAAVEFRAQCFHNLHQLLARYRAHLTQLIAEESALSHELAEAEVMQALSLIAGPVAVPLSGGGVAAVLGDVHSPLAGPLACAVEALNAGWGVILKPSPKAPSALFASAELFTRAGFPGGVVNCVHGDEQAVRALCHHDGVAALAFVGAQALSERIGGIARDAGILFAGGAADGKLHVAWQRCLGQSPV